MAGPIQKGETFAADASVTNEKLHDLVEDALFIGNDGNGVTFTVSGSTDIGTCVKDGGVQVASGTGQLQIEDLKVTTAKIADSSSKTTGVTFAKMQHISTAKVLGRASASEGDVEEAFDFTAEDDMSSNSATALASQQSVKAYVDANSVFTKSFISSDQTFPNEDTELSVAHSLGEVPKIIQVFAKMTASTGGYSSGEFVLINSGFAQFFDGGSAVSFCTASNVAFYRNAGTLKIVDRTGSSTDVTLSSSNCSLVLKAFA